MNLEPENKMCCSVLSKSGFDGDLLRLHAPKILIGLTNPVTKPQTTEILKAIADTKSDSKTFMQLKESILIPMTISDVEYYYSEEQK